MDENKKSVKRVLVLDWDAIRKISEYVIHDKRTSPLFFWFLQCLVQTGQTPDVKIASKDLINIDLAELFFKAYGKEVEV